MVGDESGVGESFPVVPLVVNIKIYDQAGGRGHDLAFVYDTELTLGKYLELTLDMLARPGFHLWEAFPLNFYQSIVVVDRNLS